MTGLDFQWVPSGGDVGVIFAKIRPDWIAYTQGDNIAMSGFISEAHGWFQQRVLAHEIGHILGLEHTTEPGSIETTGMAIGADHVTAEDAAKVRIQPCEVGA